MTQNNLTPEQNLAVSHFLGPALTLAIPGSGKTTVLIHRLKKLVETHGVSPGEILTVTFSKASATDMKTRCQAQIDSNLAEKFDFMTIHKFAYRLYTHYLKTKNISKRLLDDGSEKYRLLAGIFRHYEDDFLTDDFFESLSSEISLIYNLKLKRTDAHLPNFTWHSIFKMAEAYHLYKHRNHLFDFDDMLYYAIKLLKNNPTILASIHKKYPYIQVDEAQDTSKLQFELIELLAGPSENLFLVADDDQSIYGFRGAYPQYLLEFPQKYPKAKLYHLSTNFRSDGNIVTVASGIIDKNQNRYHKSMSAHNPSVNLPSVVWFDDLYTRNNYLANALKGDGQTAAVLYRNKISALSIMDELIRNGIDFSIKDPPISELNHWLIKDILAFITLAMIPQDLESFERIAFKTNGFISREMLQYVKDNHRGRNIFDCLIQAPFLEDYQTRTQEQLKSNFEALARLRPFDAIHFIETELGYLDYLKKNSERLSTSMHYSRTRLDAYKALAKPLKTTVELIQRVQELDALIQEHMQTSSKITLSTIHGSKGLEFDTVYMIDVNPKLFPGLRQTENDALEEERRLFYVGITRARYNFELLHCEFVNGAFNQNSKFIEEFMGQPLSDHRFNNITGKPATS